MAVGVVHEPERNENPTIQGASQSPNHKNSSKTYMTFMRTRYTQRYNGFDVLRLGLPVSHSGQNVIHLTNDHVQCEKEE